MCARCPVVCAHRRVVGLQAVGMADWPAAGLAGPAICVALQAYMLLSDFPAHCSCNCCSWLLFAAASWPMSMGLDLTGATPSVGQGIVFAINPCREEFHFGFVGEGCRARSRRTLAQAAVLRACCAGAARHARPASPLPRLQHIPTHHLCCRRCRLPLSAGLSTPAVNIAALGIKVSAQPIGVSVSNKGEIPSDHDAIGMTDPFWVGINKAWEKRVVTQGNLYITGSITVEPIVQQFDKVTVGLVGDGKVGRCSRGYGRRLQLGWQQGCLAGGRAGMRDQLHSGVVCCCVCEVGWAWGMTVQFTACCSHHPPPLLPLASDCCLLDWRQDRGDLQAGGHPNHQHL